MRIPFLRRREKNPAGAARPASAAPHLALGRRGEDLAADFLKKRRLTVLERNWRPKAAGCHGLELDIVAREGDTLVFVEVKTRTAGARAEFAPLVNYSAAKRARLKKAVALYLDEKRAWERPCRLDLVCVEIASAGGDCRIELYQNALDGGEMF